MTIQDAKIAALERKLAQLEQYVRKVESAPVPEVPEVWTAEPHGFDTNYFTLTAAARVVLVPIRLTGSFRLRRIILNAQSSDGTTVVHGGVALYALENTGQYGRAAPSPTAPMTFRKIAELGTFVVSSAAQAVITLGSDIHLDPSVQKAYFLGLTGDDNKLQFFCPQMPAAGGLMGAYSTNPAATSYTKQPDRVYGYRANKPVPAIRLLSPTGAHAYGIPALDGTGIGDAPAGGGGGGGVNTKDEGVAVNTPATTINFTGAGVTATNGGGGQTNVAIPGYTPPTHRSNLVTLDFGTDGDTATTAVVAAWLTAASELVPVFEGTTTDHDSEEDAILETIHLTIANRVNGAGFDLLGHAPEGTWGQYTVRVVDVTT